ncbi:MAG TPA: L-rhamnose mutarotase [Galbitalea sp.]|jgi:L-rhamnose mutarotase|nr:L-rhamnose mutarotase [Galbitalea sp.]
MSPQRKSDRHEIVAWRTRLRPGHEAKYSHTHRSIPEAVATALRSAGVISWRIWRDGLTLFHVIETRDGRDAMGQRMAALGPIDPEWDELIASMLDHGDGSSMMPTLVWGMDESGQFTEFGS